MSDYRTLKRTPESADVRLERNLADGWQLTAFQHVMTDGKREESVCSILLRSGSGLSIYAVTFDGERLYRPQLNVLARDRD